MTGSEEGDTRRPEDLGAQFHALAALPADQRSDALAEIARRSPEQASQLRKMLEHLEAPTRDVVDVATTAAQLRTASLPEHVGPYRILDELGHGGMGSVLLGEHEELGRKAAVKLIRRELLQSEKARSRFQREMRTLSQLDHPNICRVFEVGDDDGAPFMAMQWVRGRTLAAELDEQRGGAGVPTSRAELEQVLTRIEKVALALDTAHRQDVLHRDVKPANIMIADDGEPIVLDFGLAYSADVATRDTLSGDMIGTLPYMAPEQVRAQLDEIDRRTDVYALGVVLYECLTLQRPFQGKNEAELIRDILHAAPVPARRRNRAIPRDLQLVVDKAMDPDPARRYASAKDFADDLARVRGFEPVVASRIGAGLRLRRWSQRNPTATVAMLLLTFGLVLTTTLRVKLAHANTRESNAREAASEEARRANIASAESAMKAAQVAVTHGEWKEALERYDSAVEWGHADEVAIQLGRYDAYESLSQPEDAAKCLDWLAQREDLGQHAARVHLLLGINTMNRDAELGVKRVREALEGPAASLLGEADRCFAQSMVAEDLDTAIARLEQALKAEPRHLESLRILSILYLFAGDPEASLRCTDTFSILYQGAVEPRLIRAWAHASRGEHDLAKDLLRSNRESAGKKLSGGLGLVNEFFQTLQRAFRTMRRQQALNFAGTVAVSFRGEPPTIPFVQGGFPAIEDTTQADVAKLVFTISSRFLFGAGKTNDDAQPVTLRLHPWIHRHYPLTPKAIIEQVPRLFSFGKYQAAFDGRALPERLLQIGQVVEDHDLPEAWLLLQDDAMHEFRGMTACLPEMRALQLFLRTTFNVAMQALNNPPAGHDVSSLRSHLADDFELLLELPGVTEEELYASIMMVVNAELPGRYQWAERLLARWQKLHGTTPYWALMRAEVLLARGLRDEAAECMDTAREGLTDNPWTASLQERLDA